MLVRVQILKLSFFFKKKIYISSKFVFYILKPFSYLRNILAPYNSAQQEFTRLIREAGGSLSVKLNFFMHTMAQHLSHGNQGVKPLPHPERYTVHEVGRPIDFEIENYEKRFSPDKYFVYRIKGKNEKKLKKYDTI
jgi:hypothetical protein